MKYITVILYLLLLGSDAFIVSAQGNSLLWRISGNKLKHVSYLYGTMHSGDPRVFHFSDSVFPAIELCDGFAMEILVDEQTQSTMLKHVFMSGDALLSNLLSAMQYDSLQRFAYQYTGLNMEFFDRMKPLYVAMMLEVLSSSDSITQSQVFLDQFLRQQAEQLQQEIFALETVKEQMGIFDIMSYADQAQLLMQTIRNFNNDTGDFERMIGYYLNSDLYNMMKFENDFSLPEALYNALITNRNMIMADRIDTMINRRAMFIAVGAGHLGEEKGLIELMRNKGYTVLPVLPVFNNYLKDGWYRFESKKNRFSVEFPAMPQISRKIYRATTVYEYLHISQKSSSAAENFAVYVFAAVTEDSVIISFLHQKNIHAIDFNNATEEKYFSFTTGEKVRGKGVFMYSGKNRYVVLCSSTRKTKNLTRFTSSFDLL